MGWQAALIDPLARPDMLGTSMKMDAEAQVAGRLHHAPAVGASLLHGPRFAPQAGGAEQPRTAGARTGTPLQAIPTDLALTDWEVLLGAVTARLRTTVGATPGRAGPTPAQVSEGVLDCAKSLEQLHMTLRHELDYRHRQALELFDARTALAQLRADLSAGQALEQRAEHRALHDHLTLLPNGDYFCHQLAHVLAHDLCEGQALAVLVIGLEGLQPVDHEESQGMGDHLLRIVAARLSRALRSSDMVSHLGGGELACMLQGFADQAALSHLACKLFDTLAAPVRIGRTTRFVLPSIGIAFCTAEGGTPEAVMERAHVAMARAKAWQAGYAFHDRALDV